MKRIFQIEIDAPDWMFERIMGPKEEILLMLLQSGINEMYVPHWRENIQLSIEEMETNPLSLNRLERAIRRDVVDDDALATLALKGI